MADLTQPPEGEPLIRAIAMPADANPSGDIFGAWLMAQMDLAGGNARRPSRARALQHGSRRWHGVPRTSVCRRRSQPLRRPFASGRTSMTIRVEAWRRSSTDETRRKVTEATFTFVAIDENRKPRVVPPAPGPG